MITGTQTIGSTPVQVADSGETVTILQNLSGGQNLYFWVAAASPDKSDRAFLQPAAFIANMELSDNLWVWTAAESIEVKISVL